MPHITGEKYQITQIVPELARAAERFGTPVYVIDMVSVTAAAKQVEAAFGAWLLHYSLKANDLPAITAYLAGRGWGWSRCLDGGVAMCPRGWATERCRGIRGHRQDRRAA